MSLVATFAIAGVLCVGGLARDRRRRRKEDRSLRRRRRSLIADDELYYRIDSYDTRPLSLTTGQVPKGYTDFSKMLTLREQDAHVADSHDETRYSHPEYACYGSFGSSTGSVSRNFTSAKTTDVLVRYEPPKHSSSTVWINERPPTYEAAPYEYKPLPGQHAIRLIELHPAKDQAADLCCSFYTLDLANSKEIPISYEAISYSWGDDSKPNTLYCNEEPSFLTCGNISRSKTRRLQITDSLASALRALRSSTRERVLWADAVCINQSDGEEKMHQVREMRNIYSKATRTLVWLGEETHGCGEALRWLEQLGKWRAEFRPFTEEDLPDDIYTTIEKSLKGHSYMSHFFQRAWFRRRWVIQELIKSQAALLTCGDVQCDWNIFSLAVTFLYEADEQVGLFNRTVTGILEGLCLMNRIRRRSKRASHKGFGLLDSLYAFHSSRTARPHDLILALAGFSDNPEDYIDFNHDYYLHSPQAFYVQFVRNALERTNSLDVLHLAGAFRALDTASWIPDLRSSPRYKPFMNISRFTAGIGNSSNPTSPPTPRFSGDRTLSLEGFRVGKVNKRILGLPGKSPSLQDICGAASCWLLEDHERRNGLAMTLVADQAFCRSHLWVSSQDKETMREMKDAKNLEIGFLQLLSNSIRSNSGSESPPKLALWDPVQGLLDTPQAHRYASEYQSLLDVTMAGRCIFWTDTGYMGIGPEDTAKDDDVVVFVGSRTPFIIRPQDDQRNFFKLIGDCYVRGIMNGEALGQVEETEFVIHEVSASPWDTSKDEKGCSSSS